MSNERLLKIVIFPTSWETVELTYRHLGTVRKLKGDGMKFGGGCKLVNERQGVSSCFVLR